VPFGVGKPDGEKAQVQRETPTVASTERDPAVSVVVATRNRAALLPRLVTALSVQQTTDDFEVIIVDDASDDDTADVIEKLVIDAARPIRTLRLPARVGPATARNAGWRAARAPLIAFTDDDCAPQPGWLAALARRLHTADVVQGRTVPDPVQQDRMPFSYTIDVDRERGYYEACNIAYRREVLDRLGGFDEAFRYGDEPPGDIGPIYGEDVDLGWRAKDAGAIVAFESDAIVFHDVRRRSYGAHLRELRRGEGIVLAVAKNPRLRRQCHFRWFWMRSHPPALLAATGTVVAGVSRSRAGRVAGVAMVLPYLRHRTRVMPLGRRRLWPVAIPLALVSDLVEMAVFLRASIRHRTLVL
jgi:glycosyltransferase involved in cell wall biosynthesis